MPKLYQSRISRAMVLTALMVGAAAACSSDVQSVVSPAASLAARAVTSQTFTLSSVTPPIQCTDASGAVTTVTAGTVTLSSNGKFTAQFATETTATDGSVTTGTQPVSGTFVQRGTAITFKTGGDTLNGTLDNGTLTITNYPFCGATHTAIFTQS